MRDNGHVGPLLSVLVTAVLALSASSAPVNGQALPELLVGYRVVYAPTGDLFVTGELRGRDLPPAVVQSNPFGTCNPSGNTVPFLAKATPAGDRLVWATYLCASVYAIAGDPDGNLYLAGNLRGSGLSIAKISSDGKSLLAVTSLTAQADPNPANLALQLDAAGNVFVAKNASPADIPATFSRLSVSRPPNSYCEAGNADHFVAKFDSSLGRLLFAMRIGSNYSTYLSVLAVGPDGSSYIVGSGQYAPTSPCGAWFTVTKLSPDGFPVYAVAHLGYMPTSLALGPDGTAYLGLRYGLARALSPPLATIWKLDPRGARAASVELGGSAGGLRIGASGLLEVVGIAWPRYLAATPGGSPACAPTTNVVSNNQAYVARLSADTLQLSYASFLPGWTGAWFAGPDQLVAINTYSMSESFSPLAAGIPAGSLSLLPIGPLPAGTITCVTNAASQDPRSVAPGEIISIYGNGIGPPEPLPARFGADGNFATELDGLRVLVDGLAAPLLYAASHQINAVVPFAVPSGRTVRLEIHRQSFPIGNMEAKVTAQHPGLFMADANNGYLAALNQDGTINSSAIAAPPGSVVSIFATGLGIMTPPAVDGSQPPQPVGRPDLVPSVWANGQPAVVEYIGNAPGLIQGLVQINIRVPPPLNPAVGQVLLGISAPEGPGVYGSVWVR